MNPPATQSPPAQGFAAMAKICAAASLAAYSETPTVIGRYTNTQVLMSERVDEAWNIIAFRGTQEIEDWITDAEFLREQFMWGDVHAGFREAIYDVCGRIEYMLNDSNPGLPIYVTGHSLGGALAMLCAAMLKHHGFSVAGVITFGQPRVGSAVFRDIYNDSELGPRTLRFVNENDIVPRLPGALLGYRHCGQDYFFSNFGALELNPKFWAMAASDLLGFWEDWRIRHELGFLEDHHMSRYLEKVNAL
jgi:triacylglycerol lipase